MTGYAIDCGRASAAGRRWSATLKLGLFAGTSAIAIASLALANPQGGEVVSGQATIATPSTTQTTVTQSSDKAIIDWKSFNIGANESTVFVQPNSNSVALNRIFDNDPSVIAGLLSANGKLILINRNGLMFDSGAVINAAGLVATTSDIGNDDFMAGRLNFSTPGNPNAQISNKGLITADEGGVIAFVAPSVRNSGVITAKLGRVALGSGDTFTLDLYGDNLISFPVSAEIARQLVDADGKPLTSLIDVSGKIDAGSVQLSARAARGIIDTVINVDGEIIASGIKQAGGTTLLTGTGNGLPGYGGAISIDGGANGVVNVSGALDASSATGTGGSVGITGELVMLDGARIDASGATGGGRIAVGYTGEGTARVIGTDRIIVTPTTTLNADAIGSGDGGRIVFWSNLATDFYGELSAKGGALSGDGGFLEISSKDQVGFAGMADASAANGETGQLLLDPKNITISIFGGTGGVANPNLLTFANQSTLSLTITPNFLTTTLNTGTAVTLQANNDITVGSFSAITVNNPGGNGGALTLQAGRSVIINSNITTDNGNLTIVANELLANGVVSAQRDGGSAVLTMNSGTSINAGTGTVSLTIASGAGKLNLASGDMTLRSITAGTIRAQNLGTTAGSDVIIASGVLSASGAGTPLVLASQGGNFINNAGAGALSTPGGRWLVYSQNPGANTNGGLAGTSYYNTVYNPANPTGVSATGNKFAYSLAANLTVTPNAASREYGAANPAFSYAIMGLRPGDTLAAAVQGAPIVTSLANGSSSVAGGPYAITASLGTLASQYNYSFSFAPGQLAITPALLTYLADPKLREYGDADGVLTGTITGLKNGELAGAVTSGTLIFAGAADEFSDVGIYAITGSGLAVTSGNYAAAIGQDPSNATALSVTPAQLYYLADSRSESYGSSDSNVDGALIGVKNGETLEDITNGSFLFTTSVTENTSVGSYAILGSGLSVTSGNYAAAVLQAPSNATAYTITQAQLFYEANAADRDYGDANPGFSGGIVGIADGETLESVVSGTLVFSTSATQSSNAGSYEIDGSGLTVINSNYALTILQDPGNATAFDISPALLTYVANSSSREYGDANPLFAGTIAGFKNGDVLTSVTSGTLTFLSSATPTSNAGDYEINGGGLTVTSGNYLPTIEQDSENESALEVTPAQLYYAANSMTSIYGDDIGPGGGTIQGLKNGETLASAAIGTLVWTVGANSSSDVGVYTIEGSGLGAFNPNYEAEILQAPGNDFAMVINPAQLYYLADPKSISAGLANPEFTGQLIGLKSDDIEEDATIGTLVFTTTAPGDSLGGIYAINGEGLTVFSGNYLATILQDPSNATAFTIIPIPSTSPQAQQETLEGEDGAVEEADGTTASRSNELNIVGTNIVSDDMGDGQNDELAGQLCILGAPEMDASADCNARKAMGN